MYMYMCGIEIHSIFNSTLLYRIGKNKFVTASLISIIFRWTLTAFLKGLIKICF